MRFFCTCTLRELLCNICLKNNAFIFAYIFPTKIYLTVTLSINYKYCLDQKQSPRDIQFTFKCPVAKVSILFTSGHVLHPFLSKNFSCNLLERRLLPFLFEIDAFCVTPNTHIPWIHLQNSLEHVLAHLPCHFRAILKLIPWLGRWWRRVLRTHLERSRREFGPF
jgi:hypothetical protein